MEYDDTNRGAIFINKKRTNDNQPHMRGEINVNGVDYWISAWTKTSKNGEKYQSLSVTLKDEGLARSAPAANANNVIDDNLPF